MSEHFTAGQALVVAGFVVVFIGVAFWFVRVARKQPPTPRPIERPATVTDLPEWGSPGPSPTDGWFERWRVALPKDRPALELVWKANNQKSWVRDAAARLAVLADEAKEA